MTARGNHGDGGQLSQQQLQDMVDWLLPLVRAAGRQIMTIYAQAQAHPDGSRSALVQRKSDSSPLTAADLAAHRTIEAGLHQHSMGVPVISEESFAPGQMAQAGTCFWLVDPLDGTKEFLSGTGEFTVNVALINHRRAVLGVVYQPSTDELFWGGAGFGAWCELGHRARQPIAVAPRTQAPWRVLASRSHLGPHTHILINRIGQSELIKAGSSLKFCRIAAGLADFYPRLGYTSQWDTAAAQAVLEGAGGYVFDTKGRPLQYGQSDIINPHFLASALPFEAVRHWWNL